MTKEIREGIYDVREGEYNSEELGLIIDTQDPFRRAVIQGIKLSTLVIAVVIAVWMLIDQLSPKQKEEEGIKTFEELVQKRLEVERVIATRDAPPRVIRKAVEDAIAVVAHPQAKIEGKDAYERYLAMLAALEGLLCLDLEGKLDLTNSGDKEWYEKQINLIGQQKLYFYENGSQNTIPLLRSAELRKLILEVVQGSYVNQDYLTQLEAELTAISSTESFTIVAEALLLGKWFRYDNDFAHAGRCFDVGRKYVEGFKKDPYFYQGHRPKDLGPLWDEYVGCLEGVAELAFQGGQYRQARSYLVRIFNTPTEGISLKLAEDVNERLKAVNYQILDTNQDIKIIKQAIDAPMDLSSFPIYTVDDRIIEWSFMVDTLREARTTSEKAPVKKVWKLLSPGTQNTIEQQVGALRVNEDVQKDIINALNTLINSQDFFKRVNYEWPKLSSRGYNYYKKSQVSELAPDEMTFLNRDLLDSALSDAILNKYVLSDGTRISSSLNQEQIQQLINLYDDQIRLGMATEEEKREIRSVINKITKKEWVPRISDLKSVFLDVKRYWEYQATTAEQTFDYERDSIYHLQEKVAALENTDIINIEELKQLHLRLELSQNRQIEASISREEALNYIRILESEIQDVTKGLYLELSNFQIQLAQLVERQNHLRSKSLDQQTPLLQQLDKQVALHQKYLTLLQGLQEKEGNVTILKLNEQRKEVDQRIAVVREKLKTLSGDEREQGQIELSLLEEQFGKIVKAFETLFGPLHKIVADIAQEEEKIWNAHETLEETKTEITLLVGTYGVSGEIEQKSKRRAELLLMNVKDAMAQKEVDKEIETLNNSIAQEHARLSILIQKEEVALNTLETFYPEAAEPVVMLCKGRLAPLRDFLQTQDKLIKEYNILRRKTELINDIYFQHRIVAENLQFISATLIGNHSLGQTEANELTRYMRNLIQARNKLRQSENFLTSLEKDPYIQHQFHGISAFGLELDIVEMFQIEQDMGLDVQQYRETFDERDNIVKQLESVLIEKKALEQKQLVAARGQDQIQVDILIPKIAEIENIIQDLSNKELRINERLRRMSQQYKDHWDQVMTFQKRLEPKMGKLQERIAAIQKELSVNDGKLKSLGEGVFNTAFDIRKTVTSLDVGDLSGIDQLIAHESKLITRLLEVRQLKSTENYYRAKALWLIGKSFYQQSSLETFDQLMLAHEIPNEMLEDEFRSGKTLFEEFDESYIYSDALFGNMSKQDENEANFQAWISFLEENALRVFMLELPKYIVSYTESSGIGLAQRQDINSFQLRAKFLVGTVHLNRAVHQVNGSRLPTAKNPQAIKELDLARAAYLSFIDFANAAGYFGQGQFTELRFGSQEFPYRERYPLKLFEQAQVNLGIIATLKEEYERAIDYYREILSGLARQVQKVENKNINGGSEPIGQVEPLLVEEYQYEVSLHPFYTSLLSVDPLAHEVLFRLGRNYQLLAEREYDKSVHSISYEKHAEGKGMERFRTYAKDAIAYYSQLILTQSYSPFRRAAHFYRGVLFSRLNNVSGAVEDFRVFINESETFSGAMDLVDVNLNLDLPEVIYPTTGMAAFELGKVYFENGQLDAATEAFLLAREHGSNEESIVGAKIEYARSLIAGKEWLKAEVFLGQLTREAEIANEKSRFLYPPDLWIELGQVKQSLGAFDEAIQTLKKVFHIAPVGLVVNNELDVSNREALELLESDFRDSIRPLALACYSIGNIFLRQHKNVEAQNYFAKAETLFRLIPWKGDRFLQTKDREFCKSYRSLNVLKAKWAILKSEVLGLVTARLTPFRRLVSEGQKMGEDFSPESMLEEIDNALKFVDEEKESFNIFLGRVHSFYDEESSKLPEVIARKKIIERKEIDTQLGTQKIQLFRALSNIREYVFVNQRMFPTSFIQALIELFGRETVENKLIGEFIISYLPYLGLTQEDRGRMVELNDNLQNLLVIDNPQEKLLGVNKALLEWLDKSIAETGFGDLFIPVSEESKILVEVALYYASLLTLVDTQENYQRLTELADYYISLEKVFPNRSIQPEQVWEIVELASIAAENREDWKLSEKFHRYLLKDGRDQYFIQEDKSDRYRAELALAKALIKLSDEFLLEFISKKGRQEVVELQEKVDAYRKEAQSYIDELTNMPERDTAAIITKIQAQELLEEV